MSRLVLSSFNLTSTPTSETFNEFFYRQVSQLSIQRFTIIIPPYRKLKASARPIEEPENPNRVVSAADCRFMAFETVSEATRLWIKGREFTVARLLGDAYKGQAEKYAGGALAIFRLAPQDYHRFHSPVDGKIGPMTYIAGEYYTVNVSSMLTIVVTQINRFRSASSHSYSPRCLWRKRTKDRSHRQPSIRSRLRSLCWCNDGW